MLYLLQSGSKAVSEMVCSDVCFRKLSNGQAALFVSVSEEGGRRFAERAFGQNSLAVHVRPFSDEEVQVIQMRCSTGTVKFVFEVVDQGGAVHATVHNIPNRPPNRSS